MSTTRDLGKVLLYASRDRNTDVLADALEAARIECLPSRHASSFRDRLLRSGHELGAVVVTERALAHSAREAIHTFQDQEQVWSELPIVLLSPHRHGPNRWRPLRNVILLHQPTGPRQFRSVVQIALETRGHQFEVHDLLQRLEEQRDWLEQALVREHAEAEAERPRERALANTRRRLLQRREEDRSILARELHDTVIQRMLYLSMRLSPAIQMARTSDRQDVAELIEEARDEAKSAVKDLRRLIRELRPAGLEMGLLAALEPTFSRLRSAVDLQVEAEAADTLPDDVAFGLFRMAQEALRNIERHANAGRVRVRLRLRDDEAILWIADDGEGFAVPSRLDQLAAQDHFGLIGMEEFALTLGGDLRIRSRPGGGTCVRASIPLHEAASVRPARRTAAS